MTAPTAAARIKVRYWFSRWPLADWLNRSDKTCWARLCSWAANGELRDLREYLDGGAQCKQDSEHWGACYCCKFASPEYRAEHMTRDEA